MKRHPHLQPLSDDHHEALVLARRVRRAADRLADEGALSETWEDLKRQFGRELEPHFRVEEQYLFAPLDAAGEGALAEQARAHHARLREIVRIEPSRDRAREFGDLLHRHVRFEERELFPRAEGVLVPAALEAAGRAALDARKERSR